MTTVLLTRERRRSVIGDVRAARLGRWDVETQLTYVIALLVKGDRAVVSEAEVIRAAADPAYVASAREILRRALA